MGGGLPDRSGGGGVRPQHAVKLCGGAAKKAVVQVLQLNLYQRSAEATQAAGLWGSKSGGQKPHTGDFRCKGGICTYIGVTAVLYSRHHNMIS